MSCCSRIAASPLSTSPASNVQPHEPHRPSRHEKGTSIPWPSMTSTSVWLRGHRKTWRWPSSSTWARGASVCSSAGSAAATWTKGSPVSDLKISTWVLPFGTPAADRARMTASMNGLGPQRNDSESLKAEANLASCAAVGSTCRDSSQWITVNRSRCCSARQLASRRRSGTHLCDLGGLEIASERAKIRTFSVSGGG